MLCKKFGLMVSNCLLIAVFGKRNEESGGLAVDASPPDDLIDRLLDLLLVKSFNQELAVSVLA